MFVFFTAHYIGIDHIVGSNGARPKDCIGLPIVAASAFFATKRNKIRAKNAIFNFQFSIFNKFFIDSIFQT